MGCGASKINTELVKLCRERKELIRDIRDTRDSLAFFHMAYLQSMQNLKNELQTFMEEGLGICFNLVSDAGLEKPPLEAPANNTEDGDVLSLNNHVRTGLNPPDTQPENVSGQIPPMDDLVSPPHRKETTIGVSAYRPLTASGSEPPLNTASFGSRTDGPIKNSMFYQHEEETPHHHVMDIRPDHAEHYQAQFSHPSETLQNEVSTWNYANPFNVVEYNSHNFNSWGDYDVDSVRDGMDLRELLEREEGMPDLEDEFGESVMDSTSSEDLEKCLCDVADLEDGDDNHPDQKEVRRTCVGLTNIRDEKFEGTGKEDLECGPSSSAPEILKAEEIRESPAPDGEADSFHKEMERSKACERQDSSSQIDDTMAEFMSILSVNSLSDLQLLTEITDAFNDIILHGKEVSKLLGHYQPGTAINKDSSWIERLGASSRDTSARNPTDAMLKIAKETREILENDTSMTSSFNLSLTLEKLCIWENKLFEEVKNEEKLREYYDKESRKLKKLDAKGAESPKVEACQSALKRLTPKLDVSISIIEGIATRTHKIRDEELHPQLRELIQRMHIMWKFTFESHKKQVQAITKLQANVEATCTTSDSSLKATQKLEAEINNLWSVFSGWIKSHRAFPLLLNNWLTKFLLQEETGNALGETSPASSPQTPLVLALCSNWHKAIEGVSEAGVLRALINFKQLLHELYLNMHEEGCQRTKIEHLSSYHEKRLRNFCMQHGLDWEECASFIREADLTVEAGFTSLHALYVNLRPIRIKLTKANARHEEARERVKTAAGSILKDGLTPLLQALESFSSERFNAYETITVQSEASSTQ